MKLYVRDGVVIATHDDGQSVPASSYGTSVTIVDYAGYLGDLAREGEPPEAGEIDLRPVLPPDPA